VAEGRSPDQVKLADIASKDLTFLSPSDPVDKAVQMMREKSVRRLPVLDKGKPVGVVSIGDLAMERDGSSVLADISAAPGNH
jgi:CBS domain-containing protein